MYIVDDICYAGDPDGEIEIVEAKPLEGGMLLLTFLSGEKKLFDTTTLEGSAFLPLRDMKVFANIKVEHGFVSWCDGEIDVAPEYMHENSIPYNETDDLLTAA